MVLADPAAVLAIQATHNSEDVGLVRKNANRGEEKPHCMQLMTLSAIGFPAEPALTRPATAPRPRGPGFFIEVARIVFTSERIAARRRFRIEIGSANHTGLGPVARRWVS
jgi:hypothetical protein